MRSLFEDPDVDEIIAIDFTDYDYQTELERLYRTQMITLPFNSIDMLLPYFPRIHVRVFLDFITV